MLDNWLSPIKLEKLIQQEMQTYHLGHHLLIHSSSNGLPALDNVQIGIIGLSPESADPIRKHLYQLSYGFSGLKIADLGNFRKKSLEFCISALAEIRSAGLLPLLIGDDLVFVQSLYRALKLNYPSINITAVDERIPLSANASDSSSALYLNPLLHSKDKDVLQIGLLGSQMHFIPSETFGYVQEQNFDLVRLGDAKANLENLEPIIRNAELSGINVQALKSFELPAVPKPTPSGFDIIEASRMARYAGMSDKLKAFYLLGYAPKIDLQNQSAFAIAEILWYFIDGFYHRKGDYPISTEGLIEYIVSLKQYDYDLTFWKSKLSGRWWIQVPLKVRTRDQRHRLIPCSHADYKRACQDELPDRLVKAFKRFA